MFYAGVLAFADGMFPLKVAAIASTHRRTDLPIMWATTAGALTRWVFCGLASTLFLNKDYIPRGAEMALFGVIIFLVIVVLPEIIEGQTQVQKLMFYRGNIDMPVSFIVAFLIPWVLASLVHYIDTVLSLVCFCSVICGIMVSYANPFIFFCETVKEASLYETNFRLSLK